MAGRFVVCNVIISKSKIKEIAKLQQKKYRDCSGLFIAEGQKAVEEVVNTGIEILDIFSLKENKHISFPVRIIDEVLMKKIASTETPCEILAVAKKRLNDVKKFCNLNKIALLDSISDPGNLGTIIRSASAFGIEGIILYGNCVDLYSSKVIRSCAGNFFKIPIIKINSTDELKTLFKNHTKIATILLQQNNIAIKELINLEKYIIMFGSEAQGLSKDLIDISDKNIKLEMKNNVESLNLSVCASIIFYEISKLR